MYSIQGKFKEKKVVVEGDESLTLVAYKGRLKKFQDGCTREEMVEMLVGIGVEIKGGRNEKNSAK